MSPFDVILFDVGGVLLTNGWDTSERTELLARYGLDWAPFEERHRTIYPRWDAGLITANDYLDAVLFYQPRPFTREEFFAEICKLSLPLDDGALGILEEICASNKCRQNSWLVGALNNESRETNAYRFQTYGLRRYLKVALSSCYLGLRKPDRAIYDRTLEILGNPPERILFIDDREANVSVAQEAGFHALHFQGASKLRSQLLELEVLGQ